MKQVIIIIIIFLTREIYAQIVPTPPVDTTFTTIDSINANKFVTHFKREVAGNAKDGSNSIIFQETTIETVFDKSNFKLYEKITSQKRDRCNMTPVTEEMTIYELDGSYKKLTKSKKGKIAIKKYNSKNKLLLKSKGDMKEYYKWGSYNYKGKSTTVK